MSHCSATNPNVLVWEGKISNLTPSYAQLDRTYMGKGNTSTTSALPSATASKDKKLQTLVRPVFGGSGLGPNYSLASNVPLPPSFAETPGFTTVAVAYGASGYCGNKF